MRHNKNDEKRKSAIQYRMIKSYIVVIAVSIVSSVVALVMLLAFGNQYKKFYNENYYITNQTWQARYAQLSARCSLLSAMLDKDLKITRSEMKAATAQLEEMSRLLSEMKAAYSGDKSVIELIEEDTLSAMEVVQEMLEDTTFAQYDKAYATMKEKYTPMVDDIASHLEEIAIEEDTSAVNSMNAVNFILKTVGKYNFRVILGKSIFTHSF